MLTTADVQITEWDLAIAWSHSDVKKEVRGFGCRDGFLDDGGVLYRRKTKSDHDLKEPCRSPCPFLAARAHAPWNIQSGVVSWQRQKGAEGMSKRGNSGEKMSKRGEELLDVEVQQWHLAA